LRQEKLELDEKLLSQLLELQKARERCLISRERRLWLSQRSLLFGSRSIRGVQRRWYLSMKFVCYEVTSKVVTRMWRS